MSFDKFGIGVAVVADHMGFITENPFLTQTFLKSIVKEYPDMIRITIYKEPRVYLHNKYARRRKPIEVVNYTSSIFSLQRSRRAVKDYVLCNNFEWFCTFTIDPSKNNRYDLAHCCSLMRRWLSKRHAEDKDFAYIVIPELHKDGAVHFHALLKHFTGAMKDSKHKTHTGQPIYNITCFRSGFTTAIPITSSPGLANYVTKYLTKGLVAEFNKQRYFVSKNLIRPTRKLNSFNPDHVPPLFLNQSRVDYNDRTFYTISSDIMELL